MFDSAALALRPLPEPSSESTSPARSHLSLVSASLPRPEASEAVVRPELPGCEPSVAFDQADLLAHIPALRRRAFHWCRDAAQSEDLVQETLLRAFRHRREFGTAGHQRAWLYTVLRNLFISGRRRAQSARRAAGALEHTPQDACMGTVAGSGAPFLMPSLKQALGSLPEPFARVICLVDLEDHSYADAAAALGVPVGTVMSRLSRGRARLARALVAFERDQHAAD
jgi:RNA polymerase sigma-70 factor (ECF subfamily)